MGGCTLETGLGFLWCEIGNRLSDNYIFVKPALPHNGLAEAER